MSRKTNLASTIVLVACCATAACGTMEQANENTLDTQPPSNRGNLSLFVSDGEAEALCSSLVAPYLKCQLAKDFTVRRLFRACVSRSQADPDCAEAVRLVADCRQQFSCEELTSSSTLCSEESTELIYACSIGLPH